MTLVHKQEYQNIPVPDPDKFIPEQAITVIVPVRESGDGTATRKLELVLASLAAQDYPSELLRTIIVDDGSPEPVRLPKSNKPARIRVLNLTDCDDHWGKASAFNAALRPVTTPLVMSLDADMLLEPGHIRRLALWAHHCPGAVVLGYKRIVTEWEDNPSKVSALLAKGEWESCAAGPGARHDWFEDTVDSTGQLTQAGSQAFKAFVGASVLMPTSLVKSIGGYDLQMRLAEDTEMGYRLAQAGAVFIPEPRAQAWHLGETAMTHHRDTILNHNQALLTTRVPALEYLRRGRNAIGHLVPTVHVNIQVAPDNATEARALAIDIVSGRLAVDATVTLVADWPAESRYRAQDDSHAALRALRNAVSGEPRINVSTTRVSNPYPTPYLVDAEGNTPLSGIRSMLDRLRRDELGVVAAAGDGIGTGRIAAWRTSALSRVELVDGAQPDQVLDLVARVGQAWGAWWIDAATIGVRPVGPASPALRGGLPSEASRRAKIAWKSWAQAGYQPAAAKTIATGLARGAARKGRRILKSKLHAAASKL